MKTFLHQMRLGSVLHLVATAVLLPGLVLLPTPGWSNPSGGVVTHGAAEINMETLGHLKVFQTSNRAVITWESFDISAGEITEFIQRGSGAMPLRRVVGGNPTAIYGMLKANGGHVLVNTNGILVGAGGVVDIGGLNVLSTLDIDSENFMAGGPMRFVGNSAAGVTNFGTISKRVSKMIELERLSGSPEWAQIPKKEALLMSRELIKLQRNLSGIRNMVRLPDAVFVLDTAIEHLAVTEANKLGIPVVAVVDTNVNPNLVQYPIPGNDDAIRANELMTRVIAEAISEGRFIAEKAGGQVQNPATAVVDNAVFAADQARARAEAAIAQAERDAKLAGESN